MEVREAFEALFGTITTELEQAQQACRLSTDRADAAGIRRAADRIESLQELSDRIKQFRNDWTTVIPETSTGSSPHLTLPPRTLDGQQTPLEVYWTPILFTLCDMGGQGVVSQVIDRVGELLADVFSDLDRQVMSRRHEIRWRNHTAWARQQLVDAGYIHQPPPTGIWRITEEGRQYLENQLPR